MSDEKLKDQADAWVAPLAAELPLRDCGGKAVNLGAMLRAGLPVPDGFVLRTAAYRAFVDANTLAPTIAAALAQRADGTAAAASETIRAAFARSHWPEALRAATLDAWQAHCTPDATLAVRSSGTSEDLPGSSFAGQHDTLLGVRGEDALLEAIVTCWSSLWVCILFLSFFFFFKKNKFENTFLFFNRKTKKKPNLKFSFNIINLD